MTSSDDIWTTTAVAKSGVARGTDVADAVEARADILKMTQTAENAVLDPQEPGLWDRSLRAAFAARIARLNGADGLAAHYINSVGISEYAAVANPDAEIENKHLGPSLRFLDTVAARPRNVNADDIKILQNANISDSDIVRLTELIAFVSYQVRLVAGLTLLAEPAA